MRKYTKLKDPGFAPLPGHLKKIIINEKMALKYNNILNSEVLKNWDILYFSPFWYVAPRKI
jgi:hypothetical protein